MRVCSTNLLLFHTLPHFPHSLSSLIFITYSLRLQNVVELPMLGFMDQTVSHIVTKALTAVGLARPKHPFLGSQESCLIHVALYLKANNPK